MRSELRWFSRALTVRSFFLFAAVFSAALLSAGNAGGQPVVDTRVEPHDGHAVGLPLVLTVSVTWPEGEALRGLRLAEKPQPEGLRYEDSVVRTVGAERLEFDLRYVPEREGTFDLEPIVVAFVHAELGEQEIPGLSRQVKVGPAPVPWWKGVGLLWTGLILLAVAMAGSFAVAVVRARRDAKPRKEAPLAASVPAAKPIPLEERMLDVRRMRLEGDVARFASAIDRVLTETLHAEGVPLSRLAAEMPDPIRGRVQALAAQCEELRYARPVVAPAALDEMMEETRWILGHLETNRDVTL